MAKRSYPQRAWLGKGYKAMPQRQKLLIVGESHYHPVDCKEVNCEWCEAREKGEMTRYAVESLGIKGKHPFYRKVRELLWGKGSDPAEFWNSVSYFNALSFVFDKPGDPVPNEDRERPESHKIIANLLETLRPGRILVLGKSNWIYFPSQSSLGLENVIETAPVEGFGLAIGSARKIDNTAYRYRVQGGNWILAAGIYHPRYLKGFHSPRTKRVVQRLMSNEF